MSILFRVKPLDRLLGEVERPEQQLKRTLGPVQLTSLGIGAIIGAGIFSTVGTAAAGGANHVRAGSALVLSFVLVAIACGFAAVSNINEIVELCNIGTLFAFVLVAAGILVLRRTDPHRPRSFRAPFCPWVPIGAMVTCAWLMIELPLVTWIRFVLWLAIGLVIYFGYSRRNAKRWDNANVGTAHSK